MPRRMRQRIHVGTGRCVVDGSFMEEEKCDVIMSECFYVEVGVGWKF